MMKIFFLVAFCSSLSAYAAPVHLIPEPVSITQMKGPFRLTLSTRLCLLTGDAAAVRVVSRVMKSAPTGPSTGVNLVIVRLGSVAGGSSPEGYSLNIAARKIHISAPGAAGLFYAFQTLNQLMPPG